MDGYWKWCIRDEKDRDFVLDKIEGVRKRGETWTEEEYRAWIGQRAGERRGAESGAAAEERKVEEDKEELRN